LVVLVRSGTSANVRDQWRIAQELADSWPLDRPGRGLLDEILACFDHENLTARLAKAGIPLDGEGTSSLLWMLGACGCDRNAADIQTLTRYAIPTDRECRGAVDRAAVAAAAVEALRELDTRSSRRALMEVVKRGDWPAADLAAVGLGKQAPELLRRIVADGAASLTGRWSALCGLSGDDSVTVREVCDLALSLRVGDAKLAERGVCRWISKNATIADIERTRELAAHVGGDSGVQLATAASQLERIRQENVASDRD
jgi:hypothetical protein